jgi:hypothetical protein
MRTLSCQVRCVLLLICLVLASAATAKTVYVDDDANGLENGCSWADAYRHLQDALADANESEAPVEIRVAQGTYRPDRSSASPDGTGDQNASFCLLDSVAIKGGFAGSGVLDPNARDIAVYESILSGDLAGDDAPVDDPCDLLNEPTYDENARFVVTAESCGRSAVLDGVTIRSGSAAALYLPEKIVPCYPSIKNCTFTGNRGPAVFLCEGIEPEV